MENIFNKYKDEIYGATVGEYEAGYLEHEWNEFIEEAIAVLNYAKKVNIKVSWGQLTMIFINHWCRGCCVDEYIILEDLVEICKRMESELRNV